MIKKLSLVTVLLATCVLAVAITRSNASEEGPRIRYLPEYTESGDLILPKNWREWVFVGAPLTPNALNGGEANFPEFHNVYIEPGSYEIYKETNEFPEGTIFFKELQLVLPGDSPDGSRAEPSGQGYFPGPYNGADVTVKDSELCRFGRVGILQLQSSRAQGPDRNGEDERGMRLLSYCPCKERRCLDAVLPNARQVRSPLSWRMLEP